MREIDESRTRSPASAGSPAAASLAGGKPAGIGSARALLHRWSMSKDVMPCITVDGNEAAARIAYPLSEVIAIYPITPSSTMGELCDTWMAEKRPNRWGEVPAVVEM